MKPTILIVENDEDIRAALRAVLAREGYQVVEAGDGAEALARVGESRPAAILMDLAMPGMNGMDATRALRREPEAAQVPIVAVTASTWFAADREGLRKAGFDAVFTKPYQPETLLAELRRLLSTAHAAD